jgi:hypothetical protein
MFQSQGRSQRKLGYRFAWRAQSIFLLSGVIRKNRIKSVAFERESTLIQNERLCVDQICWKRATHTPPLMTGCCYVLASKDSVSRQRPSICRRDRGWWLRAHSGRPQGHERELRVGNGECYLMGPNRICVRNYTA